MRNLPLQSHSRRAAVCSFLIIVIPSWTLKISDPIEPLKMAFVSTWGILAQDEIHFILTCHLPTSLTYMNDLSLRQFSTSYPTGSEDALVCPQLQVLPFHLLVNVLNLLFLIFSFHTCPGSSRNYIYHC